MAISDATREMLLDLLSPLGPVKIRRMFSGGGVFLDGLMFGLVADDVLYLKTGDANRSLFEAEGSTPFVYTSKGKPIALSYWRIPERLYDEPEELLAFARAAIDVARLAVAGRQSRPSKPSTAQTSSRPGRSRRRPPG